MYVTKKEKKPIKKREKISSPYGAMKQISGGGGGGILVAAPFASRTLKFFCYCN